MAQCQTQETSETVHDKQFTLKSASKSLSRLTGLRSNLDTDSPIPK